MYNIFISHGFKEDEAYNTLVSWIANSPDADKINVVSDPDAANVPEGKNIRDALNEQIAKADDVVLIGNMYDTVPGWMAQIFREGMQMEKRIVLIKPESGGVFKKQANVPQPVQGQAHSTLVMHERTFRNHIHQAVVIAEFNAQNNK